MWQLVEWWKALNCASRNHDWVWVESFIYETETHYATEFFGHQCRNCGGREVEARDGSTHLNSERRALQWVKEQDQVSFLKKCFNLN